MTPNEYRKIGDQHLFLKKIQFSPDYLQHINCNVSLAPDIYHQPEMVLIGLKTCFYSIDSAKNNIAHKIPPLWVNFLARLTEVENTVAGKCYGVVQQTKDQTDLLDYYAAIEIHPDKIDTTQLPSGMQFITVAAACYAKFTHHGSIKKIDTTVDYIYSSWLINSGKRHSYAADLEMYDSDYLGESEQSKMYYAIPIID